MGTGGSSGSRPSRARKHNSGGAAGHRPQKWLVPGEQGIEQDHQAGEAFGRDLPDDRVVNRGVAVDQRVAEGSDAPQIVDRPAVPGSARLRRINASPMISNWRSTADRSIGSSR